MKDNSNLMDCGVSFVVSLLSYLLVGPIIYALIFPYLKGEMALYASLFIPSLFTFLLLLLIKRKRFINDFRGRGQKKLSPSLFLIFFSSSFVFLSIASLLEGATINPAPLKYKFISLFISLLFIPIQITIEEYIFRVLPLKALDENSLQKKSHWVLISIVSGILFTLPHLFNKEVWSDGGEWAVIHYFLWGALVMMGAIITEGFEFPLSMHLSNNLVVAIVANYKGSSLTSTSFFILENETSSPKAILTFLLLFAFELLIFYTLKRRRHHES
ncbi:MAG: type II CAAX prenyl endopeptidase Rce1 family protein [Candidatus Ornithospirochaeta sp.]